MAVTNRKVLQLAGSTLEKIKALAGDEVIQARELLVATDTGDLAVGLSAGNYKIIGNAGVGTTSEREAATPNKGSMFFDTDTKTLYVGDGAQWVDAGGKVVDAVENNVAVFSADGGVKDSGYSVNDSATTNKTLWSAEKIVSAITDSVNGLSWQAPVKSVVDTTPSSPVEGDRYLVISESDSNANKIITFNGVEWEVTEPVDGMAVFVESTDAQYSFNGTQWANISAGFTYAAGNGISLTDNKFAVKPKANGGVVVDTDGVAVDVDGTSVVLNESGKLEFGNLDFGTF